MLDDKQSPLPEPGKVLSDSNMRVQEIIHGHRMIPEQEPYMIVLETLAVSADIPLGSVSAGEGLHEAFSYSLPHRRKMRFLLFVDRNLEKVVEDKSIPDSEKWDTWKERVNLQFAPDASQDHDAFAYLDKEFDKDIRNLHQAVDLLRSRELDVMHNRRWTSRFLAVTGPDLICTDMRENTAQKLSTDRRFFGRGGELVYLMLNRSSQAKAIGAKVNRRLLNPTDTMNQIARRLSDPQDKSASTTNIGYLPMVHHPAYERMADDWNGILDLTRLPDGHLFEPIFRITGLNLLVYLAERAQEITGGARREPIVVDLTDGDEKQIVDVSKQHLDRHRQNANRAVEAFVRTTAAQDEGWQTVMEQENAAEAPAVIRRLFRYNGSPENATPATMLDELIHQAQTRDKNNTYKNLLPLLRSIGMLKERQRVGKWIALDDAMITALVMANVTHTMELRDFVSRLYDRYSIVIGPREARQAFSRPPVGAEKLEANLAALEARMSRLSLTRRLSDDCAFVTNPYRETSS